MKIQLVIGTDTSGDVNTSADNERFAEAVEVAISEEYPGATVSVTIGKNSSFHATGFDDISEINDRVHEIQNEIWGSANY